MAKVTEGTARAAAIVGFFIFLCGIANSTCGFVWLSYGGYQGHGLWSGIPMLTVGLLGFLSLKRNNTVFALYLFLALMTCIAAGIQAVTAGLELDHWSDFLGERKCSIEAGVCKCLGQEDIRIKDLDSCDKIPSINDIFITLIVFSIIGSLLCLGGAIAGCVGLATVPRSSPSTLPRPKRPAKKPITGIEVSYQQNNYPSNNYPPRTESAYPTEQIQIADPKGKDHYDSGYKQDYYKRSNDVDIRYGDYDRDREIDKFPRDMDHSDRDYKDNYSDRDSYDRHYDDRDYDRYSDRDHYRGEYDRDYDYDYDRRSYEYRRTPPPDDKTYL
ncbi:uncharacterized protein LOC116305633 [Actinia tenebrosa]|uniref:Uncharacterized protein LOC116305633 n=1 Tax=Actinia tenebrosa TaxID=6105 RepID=A0A6P8IWF7_ACTTE|nr:uncharacterized protein LOC116305633 [Actinia tenebrosa]